MQVLTRSAQGQRGVSLVIAIFILVVLTLLGAAMINILSSGGESVAREVLSARALFVAESGGQRALNEIFPPGSSVGQTGICDTLDAGAVDYPAAALAGIQGCSTLQAEIDCSWVNVGGVNYFSLTSTGTCGPAGSAAVRVVEIQARDGL